MVSDDEGDDDAEEDNAEENAEGDSKPVKQLANVCSGDNEARDNETPQLIIQNNDEPTSLAQYKDLEFEKECEVK